LGCTGVYANSITPVGAYAGIIIQLQPFCRRYDTGNLTAGASSIILRKFN